MILSFINIRKVPLEVLKTLGFALCFQHFPRDLTNVKDLNSTVAKRGSVFIGLMTPDGAKWFRYQRAVLMR